MSADDFAKVTEAVSNLIGVVIWPALVVFLVLKFRTQIGAAVDELRSAIRDREVTVKAGPAGVEVTAGARIATRLLEEAEADKGDGEPSSVDPGSAVKEAVVALDARSTAAQPSARRRVLWVDDHPENNRLEQRALQELGLVVVQSLSTPDALQALEREPFDVVISDMGRPPDPRAGYTLLDEMRRRGDNTPFIIYAGSAAPRHVEEAISRGALGSTNRSSELVRLVARALENTSR